MIKINLATKKRPATTNAGPKAGLGGFGRMDFQDLKDLPIRKIGKRCGFNSHAHFTKVFREEVGATPSAWRADHGTSKTA